uniref:Neur_chan_memb domain-containing protein n=1 Tax=Heterorhabditis bacteriophora TaxID=37862 RepID=A0A1I7XRH1_HETBA
MPPTTTNEFLLKSPSAPIVPPPPPPPVTARSAEDTTNSSQKARRNWQRLAKKASSRRGYKNPRPAPLALPRPPSIIKDDPMPLMQCLSALSTTENSLLESKLKRRYALEWEYLATVLDRLLLIVFSLVVFFVTFLMILHTNPVIPWREVIEGIADGKRPEGDTTGRD